MPRLSLTELAEAAKNAGVALTTASAMSYACGYLVIRARAYALGTDPGFSFIDQTYVWAGTRFVISLLFAVLLSALPILLARAVWHTLLRFGQRAPAIIETGTALVFGFTIILLAARLFSVSNLIFVEPRVALSGVLQSAVLSRDPLGMVLFVGSTALAALIVLWARSHLARANGLDALALLLITMAVLLGALLPIEQGFFFADRNVRQLDRVPEGLTGLKPPIWIVDRGGGQVVLFGRDSAGGPRLVTTKADKLDGIAIIGVANLGDVLAQGSQQ